MPRASTRDNLSGIAIVGMSGRFGPARDLTEFWNHLRRGESLIRACSPDELVASGVDIDMLDDPNYVNAGCYLDDIDLFDASFFGYSPREAETLDPQQRLLLECAWHALEDAGYHAPRYHGLIGAFAGCAMSSYFFQVHRNPRFVEQVGYLPILLGNDKDYLTTRLSYKLDLRGPSLCVQTACSTSLVAVHEACQSLLTYQCDMALAGGVCVRVPHTVGYYYTPDGIYSPDGHCRTFDARAQGTVFGNGLGIVVLKRLSDAVAEGDHIRAVIKGSHVNNDGSAKVGFTAPSLDAQTDVISGAHAMAGVEPDSITLIEAHGTATSLGDPIEIAALTQAFRLGTDRNAYCAIGSVKSNIGHLDPAAGIAGLIKAVLALEHREIPPSLDYDQPNPSIDFDSTPFFVNASLREWVSDGQPRRAGVSSFGIGGTNVHVVVEEAPQLPVRRARARPNLLVLSARTKSALDSVTTNLAEHLTGQPEAVMGDVARTLQVGRAEFSHRRIVVVRDRADALDVLTTRDPRRLISGDATSPPPPIAFMFAGQGTQYPRMASGLYREEPAFRAAVDECAELLVPHLGFNLRRVLLPSPSESGAAARQLLQTSVAQPALFVIEHALATLLMSWGIRPDAMIGHSVGEFVAACLADVFPLDDALQLVAARGRLMQGVPRGAMLAVQLPEAELQTLVDGELDIAAINTPSTCVVSGPTDAVARFQAQLAARSVESRLLHTSHAFHSRMMDAAIEPFAATVRGIHLQAPRLPFISTVTGTWITSEQAVDPDYWARHLRQPVRFSEGLLSLIREREHVLVEVGPGQTLASFARQLTSRQRGSQVVTTLRHARDGRDDASVLCEAVGRLWIAGAPVNWSAFGGGRRARRCPLPGYPFERKRFWVESPAAPQSVAAPPQRSDPADGTSVDGYAMAEEDSRSAHARPALEIAYVPPRDDVEKAIAEIWQRLLGLDQVGIHDNFFTELGGDSLSGTQLISRLRDRLHVEVPLRKLVEAPTVAELSQLIQAMRPEPNTSAGGPPITTLSRQARRATVLSQP